MNSHSRSCARMAFITLLAQTLPQHHHKASSMLMLHSTPLSCSGPAETPQAWGE